MPESEFDLTCAHCSEEFGEEDIKGDASMEWTWQQWRCPCCGSWEDWPEGMRPGDAPAR